MSTKFVAGTEGYAAVQRQFIDATLAIDFLTLHRDFAPFFPKKAGCVLDIGAGIGRDAAAFAQMGHTVVAVEPLQAFRTAGAALYPTGIIWVNDALPALAHLASPPEQFDFILASGVWHHLDPEEQVYALKRIAGLLRPDGIFALSLRNGPAGAGSHVFPTDRARTVKHAEHCGLTTLLLRENQPSLMQHKEQVAWTRLVFRQ